MRLLVVEDEAVSAAVLSAIARDLGHDVMVAPDAARALELVRDADVVLGDWFLPDLSGPELCARIQAESERFVPFVYVSAQADRDHIPRERIGSRSLFQG